MEIVQIVICTARLRPYERVYDVPHKMQHVNKNKTQIKEKNWIKSNIFVIIFFSFSADHPIDTLLSVSLVRGDHPHYLLILTYRRVNNIFQMHWPSVYCTALGCIVSVCCICVTTGVITQHSTLSTARTHTHMVALTHGLCALQWCTYNNIQTEFKREFTCAQI